jgi:hypothetical protein
MRLMEGRGWILVALPLLTLALLLVGTHEVTHLDPKKATQMSRTKATWEEKNENRALAKEYAWVAFGWRGREWRCLESLWTRESRFDHYAQNQQGSSAFGIAQILGEKNRDPRIQILRGLRYIRERYNTPCRANAFSLRKGHY